MRKVYIEAENFRDKAWGIAELEDGRELVCEMTDGYFDLYIRENGIPTYILVEEDPSHEEINREAAKYGIEFCTRYY